MNIINWGKELLEEKKIFLYILFPLLLLYNFNEYVNTGICIYVIVLSVLLNVENLFYLFISLFFFDDILIYEPLGGSITRIVMFFAIIKLTYYLIKHINQLKIKKSDICIIVFFVVSNFIGYIVSGFNLEGITILLNVVCFIFFSIYFRTGYNENDLFEKILKLILISVLMACFYGLLHLNFMKELTSEMTILRFNGTYEPNFMCFYINLAFISFLSLKSKFNNKLYDLIGILLITFAGLTISITGILILSIILITYIFWNKKSIKKTSLYLGKLIVIALLIFSFVQITPKLLNNLKIVKEDKIAQNEEAPKIENNQELIPQNDQEESNTSINENEEDSITVEDSGVKGRFTELISFIKRGDLDKLTSGRLPLAKEFISKSFNRPIMQVFFGNGPTTKELFTNFFFKKNYSHNSYLDLLYNFGLIGVVVIITYISIKSNQFLTNYNVLKEYNKWLKLIKIVILIYGLSLSLYTKRMVLLFFIF